MFGIDHVGPAGHDEDGDGVPDDGDLCPHIADEEQGDADGDGIGDACDRAPAGGTQHFFSFFEGSDGLAIGGPSKQLEDAIELGEADDGVTTVYLTDGTGLRVQGRDALISVGFTVLGRSDGEKYAELGITFGSTSRAANERGSVCFAGYDDDPLPVFLQFNHFDSTPMRPRAEGTLDGNRAVLSGSRIGGQLACSLRATEIALDGQVDMLEPSTGGLGLFVINERVRVDYVWIVTLP